jgi:catechol 2,3-dioxygenase-like lactoylglutathione lyase family enzyme
MIDGLNHITLSCSNIVRSLSFYTQNIGFTGHVQWDGGAYLTLGDLWLCLSLDSPSPAKDYTHFAFSVGQQEFAALKEKLIHAGVIEWKINKSEGDSFYFLDPDGHKLEIHVGSLKQRLESLKSKPYKGLKWL